MKNNIWIGDKVKVKREIIYKIATNHNIEMAKFLNDKIGVVTGFDEITRYFTVEFEDKKFSFRRFELYRCE